MAPLSAIIDSEKELARIRTAVGVEFSRMSVCRHCTWIYGPWPDGSETRVQRCDCREKKFAEPRWPRFDFNEVVELCRCCGQELLRSGSKWSVWFCESCKARVVAFNRTCQRTVIPIGRHSLMAGIGLGSFDLGDQSKIESKVRDFLATMRGLFESQDHLRAWRNAKVSANLRLLESDSDVPLASYLCELQRHAANGVVALDNERIFGDLCEFFTR